MIVKLSGSLAEQDGRVAVIDVAGVGYGVNLAHSISGNLTVGQSVELYIYEHIREQEHTLYGFLSRADKKLFELLLSVNGVGPKAALAVFDLADSDRLRNEITSANVTFLTQASGVGKKAAERIVVDLKDKVDGLAIGGLSPVIGDINSDALDALLSLGYKKEQALQMLNGIEAGTTESIIKQALARAQ